MRVVCDNCGAVYKIADSKLSKEVNRATCKRCGHKIIIYKPGSSAAVEAAADRSHGGESDDERTVIKSVPELKLLQQQTSGVPTIGSLTAELRAIPVPGVLSQPSVPVVPAVAGDLGPAGVESTLISPKPGTAGAPPAPEARLPGGAPVGIPPSGNAPATQVYSGPGPQVGGAPSTGGMPAVPPPAQPPMSAPPPLAQVQARARKSAPGVSSPPPPPRPPLMPPSPLGAAATPTPGARPSPSGRPLPTPPPVRAPATQPPRQARRQPPAAAAKADGGAVLGTISILGFLAITGMLAFPFVPAPLNSVAFALGGLGAAGALMLPLMTGRGANPEKAGGAIVVALLLAALVGGAHYAGSLEKSPATEGGQDLLALPPEPTPQPTPEPTPEPTPAETDGASGLDAAEAEEIARFEAEEIAAIATPEPVATPRPTPTPNAVREPTPRPTPRATPKPTPTPRSSGPTRAVPKPPSGDSGSGGSSSGPSPFVIDTIIRNNASIVRCLRVEQARGNDVSGKIYLKFSIAPEGSVSRARVTTSRFAGTSLDTCISRELNNLKFPPFDGGSKQITYPLIVQ